MNVQEMETRYHELREKFVTGAISREIFETQVARLRYQDARGRHWAIGSQTGRWHVYERGQWQPNDSPPPPAEPRCAHCGQLLPPDREFCTLCGTRVPLPPPPPVENVPPIRDVSSLTPKEPARRRPWLRIGGGIAVGLIALACLLIVIDGLVLYTRAPGITWAFPGRNTPVTPAPSPWPTDTPTASTIQPYPTPPVPTQTATPSPPAGLIVQSAYENTALGFRLRYPLGWFYAEQEDRVVFAARREELEMRNLTQGRFLAVGRGIGLEGEDTPQAALGKMVDSLEGRDILIGKVQTETLDTEAAASVLISFIPTGESLTLKVYLLVAFHAGQPYLMMAAAPVTDWPQVWPAYQEVRDSFRFIEPLATPTPTGTPPKPVTTPTRTARPPSTPTATLAPGLQFQQDGPVEPGPGDCKGTALVWGYVHDVDGRVMDGVYLFVWFEGGEWGPAPQVARTDEKGVYRLQLLTGQKGTYRVMVVKGWQDRTPLSPPSAPILVDNYCLHSDFKVNWQRVTPKTPTPTLPPPPPTVVSSYPFMKEGEVRLFEPKCGRIYFQVWGKISGLNELAGRVTIKVRSPDDTVQDFPEAIRPDGTYILTSIPAYYAGDYLIWLEEKGSQQRLSDHAVFSGVDPCQGSIYEINWKRRK